MILVISERRGKKCRHNRWCHKHFSCHFLKITHRTPGASSESTDTEVLGISSTVIQFVSVIFK